MTGLSLGATLSVKWVGLFTTAWVGSLTILQLWVLLGDNTTVTPVRIFPSPLISIRQMLTSTLAYMVQTLLCPCLLPHYYSDRFLLRNVCNPLSVLGKSRGWRRFHVISVSSNIELQSHAGCSS